MITYEFDGEPHNVSLEEAYNIVDFAMDRLGLLQHDQLYVQIIFSDDFDQDSCGWFNGIDDELVELEINENLTLAEMARTVFHELVHARQTIDGRLVQGEASHPTTWDGKVYLGYKYADRPWEIEARQLEDQLAKEYFNES